MATGFKYLFGIFILVDEYALGSSLGPYLVTFCLLLQETLAVGLIKAVPDTMIVSWSVMSLVWPQRCVQPLIAIP